MILNISWIHEKEILFYVFQHETIKKQFLENKILKTAICNNPQSSQCLWINLMKDVQKHVQPTDVEPTETNVIETNEYIL